MATFGKVMAALCVLVALGFLILAGMDYGTRQKWTHSALMHELAVYGLPLDQNDPVARLPGRPAVNEMGSGEPEKNPLLKELFAKGSGGSVLGGPPVRTQKAELDRVKN